MLHSHSATNAAGRHTAMLLHDIPEVKLLNNGDPTHLLGGCLDLTFGSRQLAAGATWETHPHLVSDHFAVITTFNINRPPTVVLPPRWDVKRANWKVFQDYLHDWWSTYSLSEDCDTAEQELITVLIQAAECTIPKKSTGRTHKKDWWFYNDEVREQNHRINSFRKLYRRNPTAENRNTLRAIVQHARSLSL
nr:uncharacterized protein LOC128703067 [Cherax quadricarinatus]